jgi:Ribosomal protein L1p/L10e family
VEGLTKVISMDEVRKYANLYKDIKELLTSHTHFFCDFGIVPELYNSLGRTFSKTNKLPVPIRLKSPAKIGEALKAAVSATYIRLKDQTRIINIRIGLTSMNEEEVVANVLQGVTNACLMIENSWNNVRSVGLKIPTSPSLPIYAKRLDESHVHPSKANHKKSEAISGKKRKATGDIEETGDDSSTPVVLSIRARKREEKESKEAAAEKSLAHAAKIERKKIARKAKAAAATKVSDDAVVVKAPVKVTKAAVKKEVKAEKEVVEAVVETKAPATASKKKGKKTEAVEEAAVVETVVETKAPATASKKKGKKAEAVEEMEVVEAVVEMKAPATASKKKGKKADVVEEAVVETKAPATASKKKGKKADVVEEAAVVETVVETKAPATASKKKGMKAEAVEEMEVVPSVETASKKKTPASAKKVAKTK